MDIELITIQLNPKQVKQYIFMQFLDSIGFFEAELAELTVNIDKDKKIRHVSLKKNYDTTGLVFTYPLDMNTGTGV